MASIFNVGWSVNSHDIIRGVTLCIKEGEMVFIIGPSGAGKTTLLEALARQKKNGRLHGRVQSQVNTLAYVPDRDVFPPCMTCFEIMVMYAHFHSRPPEEAPILLRKVTLDQCKETRYSCMSRGEKKRLSIACQLLSKERMLLLDEPLAGLSSIGAKMVVDLLRDLCDHGSTIVLSVHRPSFRTMLKCNQVLIMNLGTACFFGPLGNETNSLASVLTKKGISIPPFHNICDVAIEAALEGHLTCNECGALGVGEPLYNWNQRLTFAPHKSWVSRKEIRVLFGRRMLSIGRNRTFLLYPIFAALLLSFGMILIYGTNVDWFHVSFWKHGVFYLRILTTTVFVSISRTSMYFNEKRVVTRELSSGLYTRTSYWLVQTGLDLMVEILLAILSLICVVAPIGYMNIFDWQQYWILFVTMSLVRIISVLLATIFSIVSSSQTTATLVSVVVGAISVCIATKTLTGDSDVYFDVWESIRSRHYIAIALDALLVSVAQHSNVPSEVKEDVLDHYGCSASVPYHLTTLLWNAVFLLLVSLFLFHSIGRKRNTYRYGMVALLYYVADRYRVWYRTTHYDSYYIFNKTEVTNTM
jgi:ABC-type multidrug transport system ATPase subunit